MKNVRTLDEIAADIHVTDRDNIFRKGELLIEAKETHPGEFLAWLSDAFTISADTAERHMDVARLGRRFRKIAESHLAKTTFYELAGRFGWAKEPGKESDLKLLGELIDILVEKSKSRFLRAAEARDIIDHFDLSKEYGDYPVETLRAIESLSENDWYPGRKDSAWPKSAIAALKKQKPTTGEAVDECVAADHVAHVAKLYKAHGELPLIPLEKSGTYEERSLGELEKVDPKRRRKVLAKLSEIAAERPLTHDDVKAACEVSRGFQRVAAEQDDDAEQDIHEREGGWASSLPPAPLCGDDDTDAEPEQEPAEQEPEQDDANPGYFTETWIATLRTALAFFEKHQPPKSFGSTMPLDKLRKLRDHIDAYIEATDTRNAAQRAADRAEARSRTRH